jgi:hypothetical protein
MQFKDSAARREAGGEVKKSGKICPPALNHGKTRASQKEGSSYTSQPHQKSMKPNHPPTLSRRYILQATASLGALGALGSAARGEAPSQSKLTLNKGAVILFQGDSITDAGRKKDIAEPNNSEALGTGYAAMISGEILLAHDAMELQ